MGEEKYYPIIRKWLENHGYYCGGFIEDSNGKPMFFQNKGTARLRIDVAGVKNVGTSLADEIEVVAVEVRDADNVQYRDIQDAYAYSQYAHKCYLATTGKIDKQDRDDAHSLGIGLLKIRKNRVKEILSPKLNTPSRAKMLHFLNVLEVSQCALCGCFFETYIVKSEKYKSFHRMTRAKYFTAAREHPSVDVFVSKELKKLPSDYMIYRFICRSCIEEFFPQKIKKLNEVHEL